MQSLGIKPGGPHPGGPALGNPRSCFNVNFNSYAHGSRSGTKVPLALFRQVNEENVVMGRADLLYHIL